MSAIRDGTKELHGGKLSHFVQKVPMPSYLIALAVGVLESRKLGPRSHVWYLDYYQIPSNPYGVLLGASGK